MLDPLLDFRRGISISQHDDEEVLSPHTKERIHDIGDHSRSFLGIQSRDDRNDGDFRSDSEELLLLLSLVRVVRGREVGNFDSEFDDSRSIGGVTLGDDPVAEVEGTSDGSSEEALGDDGVGGVAARFPAVVSFVVEILKKGREKNKVSSGTNRKTKQGKETHIDKFNVRKLFRQSGQQLIHELRITKHDMLNRPTLQ